MTELAGPRPILATLGWFAVYSVMLGAVSLAFFWVTGLEPNSGVGVTGAMISAALAAQKYKEQAGEFPVKADRWKLIGGSVLVSTLLSLAAVAFVLTVSGAALIDALAASGIGELSMAASAGIIAAVFAVQILVLWFGYGPMARILNKPAQRKPK